MAGAGQLKTLCAFVLALFTLTTSFNVSTTTHLYEGEWWCEARPSILPFGREKCGGTAELVVSMSRYYENDILAYMNGSLYLKDTKEEVVIEVYGSYDVKKKQATMWTDIPSINLDQLWHMQTTVRQHSNAYKFIQKTRNRYGNASCYLPMERSGPEPIVAVLRAHQAWETLRLRVEKFPDISKSRERYGNFVAIVYLVQLILVIYQMTAVKTAEQSLRISLISIALLGYYTLELAMNRQMMFPKVVMYVCSAAYLILIIQLMRLRRPANASLSETSIKFAKVIAALVVGFVVFYYAIQSFLSVSNYLNALVQFSFFLPQIYRDQTEGSWNAALRPSFIVVTALTTVSVPIYFFFNAYDILMIPPNPAYAVVCTIYVFAQAAYLVWRHVRAKRNSGYTEIPSSV